MLVHLIVTTALLLATAPVAAAPAEPLQLSLPVDCAIGTRCLVQKLVDQDAGPDRRDYRCGTLTDDGHNGTDIRVRTLADMRRGVAVIAAADGTVLRVRDGEPDISVRERGKDAVAGRMAGNGVVIGHADGSETQYSHLRQGSVQVKPGDVVRRGAVLGFIGMSGNAEYPHVHFSIRRKGAEIDPFTGALPDGRCHTTPRGLWTAEAARALAYTPHGVITQGFATGPVDRFKARAGEYDAATLPADAPALVFWVDAFGARAGDSQRWTITGPDGASVLEQTNAVERGGLSWFAFAGKKRPANGWAPGLYRASYTLVRDGKALAKAAASVTLVR